MPRQYYDGEIEKSPRIPQLIDHLFAEMPVIEADRAVIVTESYRRQKMSRFLCAVQRRFRQSVKNCRS